MKSEDRVIHLMSVKKTRLNPSKLPQDEVCLMQAKENSDDYLELLDLREDTDEGVQVGVVLQVDIPANDSLNQLCLSEGIHQPLKVEDVGVAPALEHLGLRRLCSLQISPGWSTTGLIRKRSQLSPNNPYQRSDSHAMRTSIKTFIAPAESGENSLSLEPGPSKVLLVDDNSVQRLKMQAKLTEACKWDPDIACNGAEAVQKYKAYSDLGFRYFAIFMDTTMPEMDGFAATKQIRSLELAHNYSKTRIIGTLGSFEAAAKTKCIDAGMNTTGNA
jgi:CheY-like chemotaxis protein